MKHILVAVDLNPSSEWAFERAVELAGANGASLDAVHVIDDQLLRYGDQAEEFGATIAARAARGCRFAKHANIRPIDKDRRTTC